MQIVRYRVGAKRHKSLKHEKLGAPFIGHQIDYFRRNGALLRSRKMVAHKHRHEFSRKKIQLAEVVLILTSLNFAEAEYGP